MNWNYEGTFLNHFDERDKNLITQIFCRAYRGSWVHLTEPEIMGVAKDIEQILMRVWKDVNERLARDWIDHEQRMAVSKLAVVMHGEEARDFAEFIAKREKLPEIDRQKMKEEQNRIYQQKALAKKPASEKQIAYLKRLGYKGEIESMKHASELIDRYKQAA